MDRYVDSLAVSLNAEMNLKNSTVGEDRVVM